MMVIVCIDEAGAVWRANGQGAILAEGFFKTEDELRHIGYHRLLAVYPAVPLAVGTDLDPAELGEVFLEAGRPSEPGQTRRGPRRDDTP